MLAEIDTSSVTPEKRVEFWRQSIASAFNIEQKIERLPTTPFNVKLRVYELDRLRFSEIAGTPYKSIAQKESQNDAFSIILPLEGATVIQQDDREAQLEPGSLGFCNLGHTYAVWSTAEFWRISIDIPGKELRDIFPACNYVTATAISLKAQIGSLFLDMVHSLRARIAEIESQKPIAMAAADALVNLLRGILFELPQVQDKLPSRLEFYHKERIRTFVKTNLRANLSVESIAGAVELSPRYVHSLFSKETLSLMKWVWAERLDRCCHDLALPSLRGRSVSEIAFSWGFNDPAHFSRTFRSRFGTSPTEYREQALRLVLQPVAQPEPAPITLRPHSLPA